jgi:hypothetical protein
MMMRSIITTVLTGGVILLVFSCATVPTGPLAPGEVRLLRLDTPREGDMRRGIVFEVNIKFEAEGHPEISKVCFYWSGDGPTCTKVMKVNYGSPGTIKVELFTGSFGPFSLESYVLYIRNGKMQRTNVVVAHISIIR